MSTCLNINTLFELFVSETKQISVTSPLECDVDWNTQFCFNLINRTAITLVKYKLYFYMCVSE